MGIRPPFRSIFCLILCLFLIFKESSADPSQPYPLFKMPVVPVVAQKNPFISKKSQDVRVIQKENGFPGEHRFEGIFENISILNPIEAGGWGSASFVSFPGAKPSGTLVLWEDLTLNDPASPSGTFDFSTINADAFERVEIFQGNDPVLGSSGTGGTLKLYTSLDEKTPYTSKVRVESGSNGLAFLEGRQRVPFKKGVLKIGGMGLRTDGSPVGKGPLLRRRQAYEMGSFDAQGKFQVGERTSTSFFIKETDSKLQNLYDTRGDFSTWSHLGALSVTTTNSSGNTKHRLGVSDSLLVRRSFGTPSLKNKGEREEIRYALTHFIRPQFMLEGGGGMAQEGFYERGFKKKRASEYFFVSQTSEISPRLDFTSGGRIEETSGDPLFAFKTGVSYLEDSLSTGLTFDLAQKRPSLYELYSSNAYVQGNPSLKSEQAHGFQAMILKKNIFYNTDLGVRLFERWFSRSIIGTLRSGKTFYEVAPLYRAQGIEPFWTARFGKKVTFKGEFTYTDLKQGKNASSPLILTPPFKAASSLFYELEASKDTQESSSLYLKGRYLHYKNSQIQKPRSFVVFDMGCDWYLDAQKKIYAGVKNMLNTQYRTQTDPNIRGDPVSVYGGIEFKF